MATVISTLALSSKSFETGGSIPSKYTCDGSEISPQLSWGGAPGSTETYVLIMEDIDSPGRVFTHWVVYNIPGNVTEFEEGISAMELIRKGASQGKNDFGAAGYGGPCPRSDTPHRYRFHVYALDTMLDVPSGVSKSAITGLIKGHILAEGELIGTYKRE